MALSLAHECVVANRRSTKAAMSFIVKANEAVEKVVEGSGEGDFWGGQTIPEDVIV